MAVSQKQRAVIEFFALEGELPTNIFKILEKIYGDGVIVYRTVKKWVSRIKNKENWDKIKKLIRKYRRVPIDDNSKIIGITMEVLRSFSMLAQFPALAADDDLPLLCLSRKSVKLGSSFSPLILDTHFLTVL